MTVIIPTLNAAAILPACLASVAGAAVIVVDGGSTDSTVALATASGARILHAPPGRGGQLRHGIAAAATPYLLLLHADTILSPGWDTTLHAAKAGYFRLQFATPRRRARLLEFMARLRSKILALPYGDQGMLISADLLAAIGGVPDLPLMEDVALARRLGRRRLQALPATAVTSPARYERDGYLRRMLRNLLCLSLYFLGVKPSSIKKLYG